VNGIWHIRGVDGMGERSLTTDLSNMPVGGRSSPETNRTHPGKRSSGIVTSPPVSVVKVISHGTRWRRPWPSFIDRDGGKVWIVERGADGSGSGWTVEMVSDMDR
jgi:hypothetical protein